jgi:hypothetical protein
LEKVGSSARCWAHLGESAVEKPFAWDARNNWTSRERAAVELRCYLEELIGKGWTPHLVAHSHGGNVVLRTLFYDQGGPGPMFTGKLVLLGTPILSLAAVGLSPRGLRLRLVALSLSAGLLAAAGLRRTPGRHLGRPLLVGAPVAAAAAFLAAVGAYLWEVVRMAEHPYEENAVAEQLLLVNSEADEAFQLLAGALGGPNPLQRVHRRFRERFDLRLAHRQLVLARQARREGLFRGGASRGFRRRQRLTSAMIAAFAGPMAVGARRKEPLPTWAVLTSVGGLAGVWGMHLIYSQPVKAAMIGPVESAYAGADYAARMVGTFLRAALDPLARTWVWRFATRVTLGMDGSPFGLEAFRLSAVPIGVDEARFNYKPLPQEVRAAAEECRDQSFTAQFESVMKLVTQPGVSIDTLLQQLADLDGPHLVHSSYYRDFRSIGMIADWLGSPVRYHDRFPVSIGGTFNWRLVTGRSAAARMSGREPRSMDAEAWPSPRR